MCLETAIAMPPCAKPSVRCGPGRDGKAAKGGGRAGEGGSRWFPRFRAYFDPDYAKKKVLFQTLLRAECAKCEIFQKVPRHVPVRVGIWCFFKRPDEHFVNRVRDFFRIRTQSKDDRLDFRTVVPCTPDVDNLAKFYLDGMTGIVFDDDAQVVELTVVKMRDNRGTCDGHVAILCEDVGSVQLPAWMDDVQPMLDLDLDEE